MVPSDFLWIMHGFVYDYGIAQQHDLLSIAIAQDNAMLITLCNNLNKYWKYAAEEEKGEHETYINPKRPPSGRGLIEYPKNIPWNMGVRVFSPRFPGFWLANQMIGGILWNIVEYCGILRNMVECCGISHEISHIGCKFSHYRLKMCLLFREFSSPMDRD